jgi:hypothetical protein
MFGKCGRDCRVPIADCRLKTDPRALATRLIESAIEKSVIGNTPTEVSMAASGIRISKVDVWAGDIQDQPGGLARVLSALAERGGSIECVVARRKSDGSGAGDVFVSPVKSRRMQEAAARVGLKQASDIATLRIEGPDRPGLGGRITQAIADAGINMRGLTAAVMGRSFVAYFGLDSSDEADRAAKAIKSMNAGGRRGSMAGGKPRASKRRATKRRTVARSGRSRR